MENVVVQTINMLLGDKSTYQAQLQQNIALSVFVTNLVAIPAGNIFLHYFAESESGTASSYLIEFEAA